jgi:hypothetical protein
MAKTKKTEANKSDQPLENDFSAENLEPVFAVSDSKITVRRDGGKVVVSVPVRFYRRNGRQMIFAAGDGPEDNSKSDDNALVVALARAWQWQEELEAGEYSTVEELSAAKKIDVSYVRRMLRLNSLAPDIVEAILRGQVPSRISLRTLYRGIAPSWAEQRRQLLEI